MKKKQLHILTALCFSATFTLASCGGEPVSDNTQPEATQGDYLGNDDLDVTDTTTDATVADSAEVVQ